MYKMFLNNKNIQSVTAIGLLAFMLLLSNNQSINQSINCRQTASVLVGIPGK